MKNILILLFVIVGYGYADAPANNNNRETHRVVEPVCVPFGDKHYSTNREKVNGHWVTTTTRNIYWRKCKRTSRDWSSS